MQGHLFDPDSTESIHNWGQVPIFRGPQLCLWGSMLRVHQMPLSCEEYRYQQQLLALKKRLAEDRLNPEEREEIEKLVQELERKLKM